MKQRVQRLKRQITMHSLVSSWRQCETGSFEITSTDDRDWKYFCKARTINEVKPMLYWKRSVKYEVLGSAYFAQDHQLSEVDG